MFARLMLDPTAPTEGTGTAETPAAPPAAPQIPADFVAQFNAMKEQLGSVLAEKTQREAADRQRQQAELLKAGQLDEIKKNHDAELRKEREAREALLARTRGAELRRSLAEAFAGHDLVPGASAQLLKLWADDFTVEDGPGDGFRVFGKADLKDPKTAVAERLASAEYAHFVKAANRGGTGGAGGTAGQGSDRPAQGQGAAAFGGADNLFNRLMPGAGRAAQGQGQSGLNTFGFGARRN